jgi:probable F420-dependent oxidoreductase
MRYGITLPTTGVPLAAMADWVRAAADAGYTDLWLGESMASDAVALLAMASVAAPSLRLGTSVLPVSTRAPGLLAMSAATLAGLAPGRVSIGIGASSPAVVVDRGGVAYERPIARTRDVARFLRRALRGERVTEAFDTFHVRGFVLSEVPSPPPLVLIAGLRAGMLRMAAQEADGAVLTLVTADDIARIRGVTGSLPLVAWLTVCPYDDPADADRARSLARRLLAGYLTVPAYAAAAEWHGRGGALEPMQREWADGRRSQAIAAIPDSVVDELVIHGAPGYCRERIEKFHAAGVDVPVISGLPLDGSIGAAFGVLRSLAPNRL